MRQYTVVINDCAAVAVRGGPISIRTKETPHGPRNFMFNYGHLAEGLPRLLTEREQDWLEVLCYLFAVDLACARGEGDLDWARSISAHMPVRDPEYWQGLAPRIESVFSDFTADPIDLYFVEAEDPEPAPRQRLAPFPDADCVSLVSGGVDSFVGTAQLIDEGRRPLAVSHTAAGAITHAQSNVEEVLRARHADLLRVGLTAKKYGDTFPNPESSQRSRSFLFLGAACTVAAVTGANDVFINENGVMAIHLPLTSARIGSLSTHTASPVILSKVEGLAREVLGAPVTIDNCLLPLTKPEVVGRAAELGVDGALSLTVSCWQIGRTSKHCGTCLPCLMRRISFKIHGVVDAEYEADALTDSSVLESESTLDNLVHLVRFVDEVPTLNDVQMQLEYPEVLNGGADLPVDESIGLYRRWVDQAATVLFDSPVPLSVR